MARTSVEILSVLRKTALRLGQSDQYQWGHMGSCNCGFLAREITHLRKEDIHRRAMESTGDWSEQLNDYCPGSGRRMDDLISEMLAFGFDRDDLVRLERLSDPVILRSLPPGTHLRHNVKDDVVVYLRAWADVLENRLIEEIDLSGLQRRPAAHTVRYPAPLSKST